ncbi:hypothetical protein B0H10DRAFT_1948011 [Mycena sp. CBHHK59/15]|nr:hypothetical protein B0H10DRAFT_1948011 [Mycena sp. CBHHK59/15]
MSWGHAHHKIILSKAAREFEAVAGWRDWQRKNEGHRGDLTIIPGKHCVVQLDDLSNPNSGWLVVYGELRFMQSPHPEDVERLSRLKFVVFKTADNEVLTFRLDWTQQQLDQWLRQNLRLLFKFLDLRYPGNAAPAGEVFADVITGAEVSEAKGPAARKYTEHAVRIATKHKIPQFIKDSLSSAIRTVGCFCLFLGGLRGS